MRAAKLGRAGGGRNYRYLGIESFDPLCHAFSVRQRTVKSGRDAPPSIEVGQREKSSSLL